MVKQGVLDNQAGGLIRQKELACFEKGAGAVAELVFDGVREFGEGFVEAVRDEEGIVAKAARAARFEDDLAVACAFGEIKDRFIGC